MKRPLWIISTALLTLAVIMMIAAYFLPLRLQKARPLQIEDEDTSSSSGYIVNLARIYQSDIFGTFKSPSIPVIKKPVVKKQMIQQIPALPVKVDPEPLQYKKPELLPPLAITLNGIISSNLADKNSALISLDTTKEEKMYGIGDRIEDADIIHIGSDRVVLLRANGQQEILFINRSAARRDELIYAPPSWDEIIEILSGSTVSINVAKLLDRIPSLAFFLDEFSLSTEYENGQASGCRVGPHGPDSVASALGFSENDIIISVNGIDVGSHENRMKVYRIITRLPEGSQIPVILKRNGQLYKITYILDNIYETQTPIEPTLEVLRYTAPEVAGAAAFAQNRVPQLRRTLHEE